MKSNIKEFVKGFVYTGVCAIPTIILIETIIKNTIAE